MSTSQNPGTEMPIWLVTILYLVTSSYGIAVMIFILTTPVLPVSLKVGMTIVMFVTLFGLFVSWRRTLKKYPASS